VTSPSCGVYSTLALKGLNGGTIFLKHPVYQLSFTLGKDKNLR